MLHWYPEADLAKAIPYRMLYKKDFRQEDASKLTDLFTKRNLWALAAVFNSIKTTIFQEDCADVLRFTLTGISLGLSKMNRYMPDATFPFYLLTGTYYLPQISCEEPQWKHFENKFKRILKGYQTILPNLQNAYCIISTENAYNFNSLSNNSIDYIFTDPPYADNVQYGELNFVWESWLGFDTNWHNEEIVINDIRGKTEIDWANDMRKAMAECFRVLKPGRAISLCYHDTSEGTWAMLQDIMAEAGFVVEKSSLALFIDTDQKSFNQINADKVNKRDLIINFRKPKPDELGVPLITELDDFGTFQDKVKNIITIYLTSNPGLSLIHI